MEMKTEKIVNTEHEVQLKIVTKMLRMNQLEYYDKRQKGNEHEINVMGSIMAKLKYEGLEYAVNFTISKFLRFHMWATRIRQRL